MNETSPIDAASKYNAENMDARWRVQAFEDPGALQAFALQARRDLQTAEFQHDPEWLDAESGGRGQSFVLASRTGGLTRGLLTARVSDTPFEYSIAGRTVLRKMVRQFTIHQGPVTQEATPSAVGDCLCELARNMPPDAVAYVSAVPVGSHVHEALTDARGAIRRNFHVLTWGEENPHFKIRWEGGVDAYLASVSAKRRGNIKRALQKLKAGASHRMRRFQAPSDVDGFLRDASAISAKSYQSQELDLGFAANSDREALIRFAAARGAFVGYILYVNETPIAYRYGYIYGRTLFAISTAYDPAWSELKPGSVIFLEMLLDLEKTKVPIDLIDLLPHDNSFKRERANVVVATRNFYLFKRGISGTALYFPVHVMEACKPLAGRAATWLRRRASQNHGNGAFLA